MKRFPFDLVSSGKFIGSIDDYEECEIAIIGVPFDYTVSFKPGSRFGAQRIREMSYGLEEYSVYTDKYLHDKKYCDCGDLVLPFGNVEKSMDIIREAAREVFEDGKKPLFIGGEHLMSVPVIEEAYKKYGDEMLVLHFDAHADLREEFFGEKYSHANVLRLVEKYVSPSNIYHFGIRSGIREEFEYARECSHMFLFDVYQPLKSVLGDLKKRPIYITLDIDVVDPAFAPGTGTPEPGGVDSREMFKAIHLLKECDVIGFDLVEVSPINDCSDITSILAAKIIREAILSFM
ncbi:agmatinase [Caldanaerobius polysaccharolyticus]|uniref:agmatinase n=1 Tax=Caldanaerobius polysaccharolyticus TaxID=44256 RepID=UPI000AD19F58